MTSKGGSAAVVGLSGLARSGKDTAAGVLVREFGFIQLAFADPLKEGSAAMLGMPITAMYGNNRDEVLPDFGFSVRHFLQVMGTECVREHFGAGFWLKACARRMQALRDEGFQRFVISDARFDNEAEFCRDSENGHFIQIERAGLDRMTHASEAGVTLTPQDTTLHNNSTIGVFEHVVRKWAQERGL